RVRGYRLRFGVCRLLRRMNLPRLTLARLSLERHKPRCIRSSTKDEHKHARAQAQNRLPKRGVVRAFSIENLSYAQWHVAHPAHQGLRQRQASSVLQLFGKRNQRRYVSSGTRGLRQNYVVAGHLPLERQAVFNPPDCGVKEEHSFHDLLGEVGPIIPSAKMRELMEQNYFDLLGRELRQQPCRENNAGLKETDCCRNGYLAGNVQFHSATGPEVSKGLSNGGTETRDVRLRTIPADLMYPPESDAQPEKQQTGNDAPGGKQIKGPGT